MTRGAPVEHDSSVANYRKQESSVSQAIDFPRGGFSPPEGRLARGYKPPAFSRFLFQSAVQSAESF